MSTTHLPTVTLLESRTPARYRIEGGAITDDWAQSLAATRPFPTTEVWCEITTWDGEMLGSFGGTVWPSAWPALFEVGPRTTHGQYTTITALGKELLAKAGTL